VLTSAGLIYIIIIWMSIYIYWCIYIYTYILTYIYIYINVISITPFPLPPSSTLSISLSPSLHLPSPPYLYIFLSLSLSLSLHLFLLADGDATTRVGCRGERAGTLVSCCDLGRDRAGIHGQYWLATAASTGRRAGGIGPETSSVVAASVATEPASTGIMNGQTESMAAAMLAQRIGLGVRSCIGRARCDFDGRCCGDGRDRGCRHTPHG
jgi:hypothetical protein